MNAMQFYVSDLPNSSVEVGGDVVIGDLPSTIASTQINLCRSEKTEVIVETVSRVLLPIHFNEYLEATSKLEFHKVHKFTCQ